MNDRPRRAKRNALPLKGYSTKRRKLGRHVLISDVRMPADSDTNCRQNRMSSLVRLYLLGENTAPSCPSVDSTPVIESDYNTLKQSWNSFMNRITDSGSDETLRVRCRNCKTSDFVQYTIQQTRSSDEGSTIFFFCTRCNARWRK